MVIRKEFGKVELEGMRTVAVADKISDYLTPASVIAEPQVSIVTEIQLVSYKETKMSFLTRCVIDATRSPFSFLG